MDSKKIISKLLNKLASEVEKFNEIELEKLASGEYQLSVTLIEKKNNKNSIQSADVDMQDIDFEKVYAELKLCKDRETGYSLLLENFNNRKQLELFAKKIDVFVMKQDKIEKIRDKIVQGVIGATLRSNAIQET